MAEKKETKKVAPEKKCGCGCDKAHCDCAKKPDSDRDITLLEQLFDEENDDNIVLFDDQNNEIELEQIAAVTHEGEIYAVLHVVGDPEEEALVFHINPDDEESIQIVDDEKLANKILEIVMKEGK
jgi:hypothetical protein